MGEGEPEGNTLASLIVLVEAPLSVLIAGNIGGEWTTFSKWLEAGCYHLSIYYYCMAKLL